MSPRLLSYSEGLLSYVRKMSLQRRISHVVIIIAFIIGLWVSGFPPHTCVLTMIIVLLTLVGVDCCITSCRILDAHSNKTESLDKTKEFAFTPEQKIEARRIIAGVQSDSSFPWLASFLKHIGDQARMSTQVSVPHAIEHLKSEISRSFSMLVMSFVLSALLITGVASTIYSMQASLPKLIEAIKKITHKDEFPPDASSSVKIDFQKAKVEKYGDDSGDFFEGVKNAYLPSLWAIGGTILLLIGRSCVHRSECTFLANLETAGRRIVDFHWPRSEDHSQDKLAESVDRMANVFSVKDGGMDHALDVFTTHSKQLRKSITLATLANRKIPPAIEATTSRAESFIEKLDLSRAELASTVSSAANNVDAWASRSETITSAARDVLMESKVVIQQVATTVDKTAASIGEQTVAVRTSSEAIASVLNLAKDSVFESATQLGKRFDSFEHGLMGVIAKIDTNQSALTSRLEKLESSITSLTQTVAKTMQDSTQVHREFAETSRELKMLIAQGVGVGESLSKSTGILARAVQALHEGVAIQLPPLTKAVENATTISNQTLQTTQATLASAGSLLASAENSVSALGTASVDLRATLESASASLTTTNGKLTDALPQLASILQEAQLAAFETSKAGTEISTSLAVLPATIVSNAAAVADNARQTFDTLQSQINFTVETSLQRLEKGITAIATRRRRTKSDSNVSNSDGSSGAQRASGWSRVINPRNWFR
jgi:hypothetical protein